MFFLARQEAYFAADPAAEERCANKSAAGTLGVAAQTWPSASRALQASLASQFRRR